mmetsp:Transcript_9156/g.12996  ORF Transcript_9156/g.12996 Transcript_9156/m.12996 type:complete len:89 (-) Transcript_9156:306-572(-)
MIGAKKIERKKKNATNTDVRPVRLPTSTPAALSMYEVIGDNPKSDPNIVASASVEKAARLLGKSPFSSIMPIDEIMASNVPDVSRKST